jgi:hypothetical protein
VEVNGLFHRPEDGSVECWRWSKPAVTTAVSEFHEPRTA